MRHSESALVVLVLVLVTVSAVGVALAGTGSVAAQDNATDVEDDEDVVVATVDDQVVITGYDYDDDREVMSIELDHVEPDGDRAWVTLTEAVSPDGDGAGSGSFGISQLHVDPGEDVTAEVDVSRDDDGAAQVLVTTDRSVEAGTGTFVADVDETGVALFSVAATWRDVQLGVLGGSVGVVAIAVLIAWQLVAGRRDRVEREL